MLRGLRGELCTVTLLLIFVGCETTGHKSSSVSRVPLSRHPPAELGGSVSFSSGILHVGDIPGRWKSPPFLENTSRDCSALRATEQPQAAAGLGCFYPMVTFSMEFLVQGLKTFRCQFACCWIGLFQQIEEAKASGEMSTQANSDTCSGIFSFSQRCPTLCVDKRSKTDVLMINIFGRIQIYRWEW